MALTVEDAVPYRRINLQIIVKYQEMGYVAKVVTDAGTVTADVFSECEEFVPLPFGGGDDNVSLDLLKRLANDMKETDRKPIVPRRCGCYRRWFTLAAVMVRTKSF